MTNSQAMQTAWRRNSAVFDERADEYDSWYDDSLLFDIELTALQELQTSFNSPKLEVGVGSGRFAAEIATDFGLDPAFSPLQISRSRNIGVMQGVGECLPLADSSIASVYMLFSLCFVTTPQDVLAECYRVLRPAGHLVLGFVPASGVWGQALNSKKENNHPFYKYATFYTTSQVELLLENAGFSMVEQRSSLFQQPDRLLALEHSRQGLSEQAGFCLLVGKKGN